MRTPICSLIEKNVPVALLNQRLSTRKIAEQLDRSEAAILYWERKYGLSPAFASYGSGRRKKSLKEIADDMAQAPVLHRRRLKASAIECKGGKCALCVYDRCNAALELHRLDKATKGICLANGGMTRPWESISEPDKCILLL